MSQITVKILSDKTAMDLGFSSQADQDQYVNLQKISNIINAILSGQLDAGVKIGLGVKTSGSGFATATLVNSGTITVSGLPAAGGTISLGGVSGEFDADIPIGATKLECAQNIVAYFEGNAITDDKFSFSINPATNPVITARCKYTKLVDEMSDNATNISISGVNTSGAESEAIIMFNFGTNYEMNDFLGE